MANISISDLYRVEGPGEKYGGILNAVFQEAFTGGIPEGCDERTWIELLTVKHTFLTAMKMAEQGDVVSELTETAPPFCISERINPECGGAHSATCYCSGAQRESNRSGALLCISSGSQICGAEACRFGPSLNCAPPGSDHHTFAQDAPPDQPETGKEETE